MSSDPARAALEARVTELEIRYTHQDDLVETLSAVIRDQHTLIDGLRRRIERLEAHAERDDDDDAPPDR